MAAAPANHYPLDWTFTDQASLPFTPVHPMLELEKTLFAVGIDVIGNGRSPESNGFAKHRRHCVIQPFEILTGERGGPAAWSNSGAKKRLVSVDVAHPTQEFLIEQSAFDRSFTASEKIDKLIKLNLERFKSSRLKIFGHAQSPKAPRIDEAQFPA